MSSSTADRASARDAWEREYAERHAYTTSYRDELDRGVEFLLGYVAVGGEGLPGPVLECACGRGRNAIPLAALGHRVIGLDHALHALGQFRDRAVRESPRGAAVAVQHDLREPLPIADACIGTVVDITAIDNLVLEDDRRRYGRELARVLRPGGLAVIVTFDRDDGYYGPFLRAAATAEGVVQDPHTGISNQLFRAADLDAVLCPGLQLMAANRFDFIDEAAQERWTRRFHLRLYRRAADAVEAVRSG